MNYKRGKSKRAVRCTLCTPHRWRGNSKDRFKRKDELKMEQDDYDIIYEFPYEDDEDEDRTLLFDLID